MPEKNIIETTPLRKDVFNFSEGTSPVNFPSEVHPERGEESGYFNKLKGELRELQAGGADIHLALIDVDVLSDKALDLYRKYKKDKLGEEEIAVFRKKTSMGDSEYQFAAMLLNWLMKRATDRRYSSKDEKKAA